MADAVDCLEAFLHWAKGGSPSSAPALRDDAFLLPNATWVPGWNHIWAKVTEKACESIDDWALQLSRLRRVTKLLRIDDYRLAWSAALRRAGHATEADSLKARFRGSFLHWRWETIATVCSEVTRLRQVFVDFWDPSLFGHLEDVSLLNDVTAAIKAPHFLVWAERLSEILDIAEVARVWGNCCACHPQTSGGTCSLKSRRLHEAPACISSVRSDLRRVQQSLTLERCAGIEAVLLQMAQVCNVMLAEVELRFSWPGRVPYLLANVCTPSVASEVLRQWADTERHHRVTKDVLDELLEDIRAVAESAAPSSRLNAVQKTMRMIPLSEAPIEGYHAVVAREVGRAHGAKLPYVFARLRADANFERIERFSRRVGGASLLAFEWNRYKKILKVSQGERGSTISFSEFRRVFYRLRGASVGDVRGLGSTWSASLASPMSDPTQLQR